MNPLFDTDCNWNEREYELAAWGFAKWKQHQARLFCLDVLQSMVC